MYRTGWRNGPPEIAVLPDLELGGRVMSLHQALIRDAEATGYNNHQQGALRAALDAYLGAVASQNGYGSASSGTGPADYPANLNSAYPAGNPYANREAAFNTLFSLLTNTDGIDANATTGAMNARHAAVLEKVYGGSFQNPDSDQAVAWELSFRRLLETYYGSLAAQTHLKSAYDAIHWEPNLSVDQTIGQLGAAQSLFDGRLVQAQAGDAAATLAGGSTVTTAQDGVNAEINEFGRILRGMGFTRNTTYFAFREHFITYPDGSLNELRAFAFDAAGVPLSPIEDGSFERQNPFTQATLDTVGNNALLSHHALYGNGGDDVLYDLTGQSRQVVGATGDNTLYGGPGDDPLFAHEGNEVLDGGLGNDSILVPAPRIRGGEAGIERFMFDDGRVCVRMNWLREN